MAVLFYNKHHILIKFKCVLNLILKPEVNASKYFPVLNSICSQTHKHIYIIYIRDVRFCKAFPSIRMLVRVCVHIMLYCFQSKKLTSMSKKQHCKCVHIYTHTFLCMPVGCFGSLTIHTLYRQLIKKSFTTVNGAFPKQTDAKDLQTDNCIKNYKKSFPK